MQTWFVITEEKFFDALSISALKLTVWTDWLVGVKVRTNGPWLSQLITVGHLKSDLRKVFYFVFKSYEIGHLLI